MRNQHFSKPKNTKKTISRVLGYMGAHKFLLFVVVLMLLLSSLISVVGTSFLSVFLKSYVQPSIGKEWSDVVWFIGAPILTVGIFYLLGVLASYLQSLIMVHISAKMLKKVRDDMFTHMETLPISYFDTHSNGELMSRYTNDVDTLRNVMTNG
ncbi:MAG: ABC transporter ATP-binding protein, partial [Clostridia bacterium]|nr:ABC transporter ATP-binding protein [Clostridia bacterium]